MNAKVWYLIFFSKGRFCETGGCLMRYDELEITVALKALTFLNFIETAPN